jgi:hypothetical protein
MRRLHREDLDMRISDDRYSRDRLRLDLALRFIRHEARTQTIRAWTGLTDDRIRKLYRSYFDRAAGGALPRPRGRSPRRASFFLRNPRLKQEAALIASLCLLLGALPRRAPRSGLPLAAPAVGLAQGVPQGIALCEAYEAYRALVPAARISFEHLVYLFSALSRGDELKLASCAGCGAVVVVERMALKEPRCPHCADLACEGAALRV